MQSINTSQLVPSYQAQAAGVFPYEVWLNIFSNLSSRDLGACMLASTELKDIAITLWEKMFLEKFGRIEHTILTQGDQRSWRQNYQLGALVPFFRKIAEVVSPRQLNNNEYKFVRHGKKIVVHLENVKFNLKGNKFQRFTHLAVSGDFLFALCKNGEIVQWNYKEKIVVRTIETEFRRKEFQDQEVIRNADAFIVEEGSIFIKFHQCLLCEVISYSAETVSSEVIAIPSKLSETRMIKKEDKVYFLENNRIKIFDLSTKEIEEYRFSDPISDKVVEKDGCIFLMNNTLCVATESKYEWIKNTYNEKVNIPDKRITLFDSKMKPRYFYCQKLPKAMTIVNNSLILAHIIKDDGKPTLVELEIYDLRRCVTSPFMGYESSGYLRKIHSGYSISYTFDAETGKVDPDAFKKLLQVIEEQSISLKKKDNCIVG